MKQGPLTFDIILESLPSYAPCGMQMRYEPEYDQIREARRVDDASLPTGIWQSDLKRADWDTVLRLARDILERRSKDLMIAAWLGEAWLNRYGLAGLEAGLAMIAQLCEKFWVGLYPLPDGGDQSFRAGPLSWLDSTYAAALASQVPLFVRNGPDAFNVTLNDWSDLMRRQLPPVGSKPNKAELEAAKQELKQLQDAVRSSKPDGMRETAALIASSTAWLDKLDNWCAEKMGHDAPSFAKLRDTLNQIGQVLQEFLAMHPSAVPEPAPSESTAVSAPTAEASLPRLGQPSSREDAYRQLSVIADFLARTEPHSPVPYLVQRAVEWGQKPLHQLLAELIDSDPQARRLWTLLGILP